MSAKKYVFAHFMVGNTYPYQPSNFETDISDAIATGIDGFALNIGQDDWTESRIQTIFSVARNWPFKLFFSFDMSIITSPVVIRTYIERYVNHPNSLQVQGRCVVSTFAGEQQTFGHEDVNTGWTKEIKLPLRERG